MNQKQQGNELEI